jgi:hypothetical protein
MAAALGLAGLVAIPASGALPEPEFAGTISNTDPSHSENVAFGQEVGNCEVAPTTPSTNQGSYTFYYDTHELTNTLSTDDCYTVAVSVGANAEGSGVIVFAYEGSYDPQNPEQNFLARSDPTPPGGNTSFEVLVPAGAKVIFEVENYVTGEAGFNYTLDITSGDADGDEVQNHRDNCATTANTGQGDKDDDGIGNACDPQDDRDPDFDGIENYRDNCNQVANEDQADSDGDGKGDACDDQDDSDDDGDGVGAGDDNCPNHRNPGQVDSDKDGAGDACDQSDDRDPDKDEVVNEEDNCPLKFNPGQKDADADGTGDACRPAVGPGVTLAASDLTPPKGSTFRFLVSMKRCQGHQGTNVNLKRYINGGFKVVATKKLDEVCNAFFRVTADFKKATFLARWPRQDHDHAPGRSGKRVITPE